MFFRVNGKNVISVRGFKLRLKILVHQSMDLRKCVELLYRSTLGKFYH